MDPPTLKSTIFPMAGYVVSFGATPHNLAEGTAIQDFIGPDGAVLDLRNLTGKPDKIHRGFQMNWGPSINYINYPITDMNIPVSMDTLKRALDQVLQHKRIYVHCRGGHGRAGLAVATLCLQAGTCTTPQEALKRVRAAHQERIEMEDRFRKMGSPQRPSQKQFVKNYSTYLKSASSDMDEPMDVDDVVFYEITDEWGEFSNFWSAKDHRKRYSIAFKLDIDGKRWPTTEAYFQAQKFLGPHSSDASREYADLMVQADTPAKLFKLARQRAAGYEANWKLVRGGDISLGDLIKTYKGLGVKIRPDWDSVKDDVMQKALHVKFTQNSQLTDLLMRTGNRSIVEHTSRDSYWADGGNGKGQNKLGKMLVELREKLRG
jgi:N-glycosidase YbiA